MRIANSTTAITTKELYNLKGYIIGKTSRKQLWKTN